MTTAQLLHFVVRNVTYTITAAGVQVVCYSNNPCHLWLRWTNIVPQKHVNTVIVRGAPMGTYIDQCFVVYTDVEQQELGDTWTHTFILEPWPVCETRWFYFWGTVSGVLSPSRSAIFSYHRISPPFPTPRCKSTLPPFSYSGTYSCYRWSCAFQPTIGYRATSIDLYFKRWGATLQAQTGMLHLFTANPNCSPATIILGPVNFTLPPLAPNATYTVNVPFTPTILTAGVKYAFAWMFYDYQPSFERPYIGFGMASHENCTPTPACSRQIWIQRYDQVRRTACTTLLQDWYQYTNANAQSFQFYGHDLP